MDNRDKIKTKPVAPSWKDSGFDKTLQRNKPGVQQGQYIKGADFNATLQELLFNRMIKLKNLPGGTAGQFPQGADPGKIFWDKDNKKYKLWVDSTSQWVDLIWTSTSTSTTSSSSSSSSSTSTSSTNTTTSSSSSSSSSTSSTSSSSSTSSTSSSSSSTSSTSSSSSTSSTSSSSSTSSTSSSSSTSSTSSSTSSTSSSSSTSTSLAPDYALQTDGSQNYIDITTLGTLGSNLGSGLYIDFKIKTTATGYAAQGLYDGGNYFVQFQFNSNYIVGGALNHGLAMYLSDPSGNTLEGGCTSPSINFNDGSTHELTFIVDFSAKTITIKIDGTSQTITYNSQQALSGFTNFTNKWYIGARDANGTADNYFAATFDNFSIGTSAGALYGKYLMDDGSGTSVADSSGNSNTGTLHKGAGSYPSWVSGL